MLPAERGGCGKGTKPLVTGVRAGLGRMMAISLSASPIRPIPSGGRPESGGMG